MHLDRYGNPIEELRPLTREIFNEFINKFETLGDLDEPSLRLLELENNMSHYHFVHSYIHPYECDDRYGVYHDLFGVELIPALYDELRFIDSIGANLVYIARRDGKYGIVKADGRGTIVYPFICDGIEPYDEIIDLCSFRRDGKVGLLALNNDGSYTEQLPAIYDSLEVYIGTPYIELCKDGKVGLYGAALPLPPIYDEVCIPRHLGWIKVKHHGQWGYIDYQGRFTTDINQAFLYHSSIFI